MGLLALCCCFLFSASAVAISDMKDIHKSTKPHQCLSGEGEEFSMYMPAHNKNVTVPKLSLNVGDYAYAADNALVAVPASCYWQFQAQLGYAPNIADRQPGGPRGMFYFRISNPEKEYPVLANMTRCAKGLVLSMHGTSGAMWQSASMAFMLAGMEYVTVMPDSIANPDSMGYKGRGLRATGDIPTTNYCGKIDPYTTEFVTWANPFNYKTKVENVLEDTNKYRDYVQRVYLIRKLELDAFISSPSSSQLLTAGFPKIFLFGRSEGAMVAQRYYHADLHPKLAGLILSGWSCEFNYFLSCAADAMLCGGSATSRCRSST